MLRDNAKPTGQNGKNQGLWALPVDWRVAAGVAVAMVLLTAGAFVMWRRKRKRRPAKGSVKGSAELAAGKSKVSGELAGVGHDGSLSPNETAVMLLSEVQEKVVQTARVETIADELRVTIAQDPELAASVLRTWFELEEVKKG